MTERLVLIAATPVLAAIGLLPVAAMLKETLIADGRLSLDAYRALLTSSDHLASLMGHSLQLAFVTACISTLVGVPLGVLLGKTDLPLRGVLALLFAVPLLIPSCVLAVARVSLLDGRGFSAASCPLPGHKGNPRRSLGSSVAFWCSPPPFMTIAMLLTMTFLRTVNPELENAARLVSGWPGALARKTLPLVSPAFVFAAVLVFLLAFGARLA